MKTNRLIPMTDFVLGQSAKEFSAVKRLNQIIGFAEFLKQPLKLEMFVPCDDEGNVLEKPQYFEFHQPNETDVKKREVYQKSKEKVLFEGFYWEGNYAVCMAEDEMIYIDDEFMQNMTIDKFLTTIITDLQLTPTALKQIGL